MSFPISPTNGQQTVLNGITYTFNSTDNAWVRVVGTLTSVNTLAISGSTASTSTTTGALTVTGGVGIGGNINFGGNLYQNGVLFTGAGGSSTSTTSTFTISNTSSSTSTTTGALVVAGGVGIGGNINFGGNLYQNGVLFTGSSTSTTSTFTISNTSSSTSTTTGALVVAGGVGIGGNINFGGTLYQNGVLFAGTGLSPIVINDISTQFDGVKTVFTLRQDQDSINTIVDSKDLEVVINGARLTPYVTQQTYPWLMDYDSFRGFRVSGSNLIIFNAPAIGDSAAVIVRSMSASVQTRKYPYSATTIAFGD